GRKVGNLFSPGADGSAPPLLQMLPLLALVGVFYLILFRPEQKRRREHEQVVAALKRGDRVVMASGIHGRVTGVADKTVTVEIARKVRVEVDRSAIQTVVKAPALGVRGKGRERSWADRYSPGRAVRGAGGGRPRLPGADLRPAGAGVLALA